MTGMPNKYRLTVSREKKTGYGIRVLRGRRSNQKPTIKPPSFYIPEDGEISFLTNIRSWDV
jgi:hypothetical protein